MLNSALISLKAFRTKGGFNVFFGNIGGKLLGFISTLIVLRILNPEIFGIYSFALALLLILEPLMSLGISGGIFIILPAFKYRSNREFIFKYVFKRYMFYSFIFMCILIILFHFIDVNYEGFDLIFDLLLLYTYMRLLADLMLTYFRVEARNTEFAKYTFLILLTENIIGLFLLYLWGIKFFIIGKTFVILSFLLFLLYKKFDFLKKSIIFPIKKIIVNKLITQGIMVSLANLTAQMNLYLDIIIIGILSVKAHEIATYRAASIIPINLAFIPVSILAVSLINITQNRKDKLFIKRYFLKHSILFLSFSIIGLILWFFFGDIFVKILGEKYINSKELIDILVIYLIFSFTLRIPIGNILGSLGKQNVNIIGALSVIILNILFNIILYPTMGIRGVAISTVLSISIPAVFMAVYFYKKILK